MVDKELLELANKALEGDPDLIVDLYDGSIAYISKKAANPLGHTPEEIKGKRVTDCFLIEGLDMREVMNKDALQKRGERRGVEIKSKNGKSAKFDVKLHVLEYDGVMYQSVKII